MKDKIEMRKWNRRVNVETEVDKVEQEKKEEVKRGQDKVDREEMVIGHGLGRWGPASNRRHLKESAGLDVCPASANSSICTATVRCLTVI